MPHKKLVIISIGLFCVVICLMLKQSDNIVVKGKIDEDFLEKLRDVEPNTTITIRSNGGYSKYAIEANEIIYDKGLSIIIDDYCFSACAEYILLSSSNLSFVSEPIVAVHGNPLLHQDILDRYRTVPSSQCYTSNASKLKYLYDRINANPNFRHEQEKRLIIKPIKTLVHGCPQYKHEFVHKYWFPTSDQLRKFMGINFTGTVCADNPECVERRLMKKWKKGTTFIVGNEVHVSIGQ